MSAVITEFAPAKINLALHVLGRRMDGYHELDSVVAFADVGDVLSFTASDTTILSVDGPFAADVPVNSDNLVLKAYAALKQHGHLPAVHIHLTKNLPVASGIGGGSADAAAALRGLMRLAKLRFETETIQQIALSLGADVPVCLHGKACRMQGVGEIISPLERLPAPAILLVNPLQPCGTADVFRGMALKPGDISGTALDVNEPLQWRNDMASLALLVLPVIGNVLRSLKNLKNARAVRMSGSGATCFALFDTRSMADEAAEQIRGQHPNWWVAPAELA
jgi:4-diphosphocytidyl-2-C-methyl-D-erythritol kinase